MKLKLNTKEIQILAVILAIWGFVLIGSGISLNGNHKKIVKTTYTLTVEKRKIPVSQAKINEIKLKTISIEVNNPISGNVEDYIENSDKISKDVLSKLKLDTSLVNINQAGTYTYTITYNKKKYQGIITIKEKELPDVDFTLKNLEFDVGTTLSTNPRSYIVEQIPDEVYNALQLNIADAVQNQNTAGVYKYYITYKNTTYTASITFKEPGPTIITKKDDKNSTGTTNNTDTNTTTQPQS